MAKFVFKLESVLNLKRQLEDTLKNELGKAIKKLEHEKAILFELETQSNDYINIVNSSVRGGITVDRLKEYNHYISYLKSKMDKQKISIRHAQNNVDINRERLVKAVQEKEMLQKLKDKKLQDFLKEQLMKEQMLADELVSYKYSMKLAGEFNG